MCLGPKVLGVNVCYLKLWKPLGEVSSRRGSAVVCLVKFCVCLQDNGEGWY